MTADGAQTRERLLTEARDLYLEQGLTRFSLREVARRTGITAAAVYRHFDSREALLREVCDQGFRIFAMYLMKALEAAGPRARLMAAAQQYLRFGLENARDYRVIFMSAAEDAAAVAPAEKSPQPPPTFQFLVDRVRECMDARVLAPGDPDQAAIRLWSQVHGLTSLRIGGILDRLGSDAQFEKFYDQSVESFIDSLKK
jgi:AcrR family transcriptional regulator